MQPAPSLLARARLPRPQSMNSAGRDGFRSAPPERLGMTPSASVRHRDVAIVDQVIDRLLDVDAGADDARLLQRKTGLEDRLALRRSDLVVGELGALLELLVDDGAFKTGHADEGLLQIIVVGERILARL